MSIIFLTDEISFGSDTKFNWWVQKQYKTKKRDLAWAFDLRKFALDKVDS